MVDRISDGNRTNQQPLTKVPEQQQPKEIEIKFNAAGQSKTAAVQSDTPYPGTGLEKTTNTTSGVPEPSPRRTGTIVKTRKNLLSGGTVIEEHNDHNGNVTRSTYKLPNGKVDFVTESEYDEYGRENKTTFKNADGKTTSVVTKEYDDAGNLHKEIKTNAKGKFDMSKEYKYDENGKLTEDTITFSKRDSITSKYDENGDTIRVIQRGANGKVEADTINKYSGNHQLISSVITYPDKSTLTQEYNDQGKVKREIQKGGWGAHVTDYGYDSNGNCITEYCKNEDGSVVITENNSTGKTIKKTYKSPDGKPTSIEEFKYYKNGNHTIQRTYKNNEGETISIQEDTYNRNIDHTQSVVKDGNGKVRYTSNYKLAKDGTQIGESRIYPNGVVEEYSGGIYDAALIRKTTPTKDGGKVVDTFNKNGRTSRVYDKNGKILRETSFNHKNTALSNTTYKYDPQGHLKEKSNGGPLDMVLVNGKLEPSSTVHYTYGPDGKILHTTRVSNRTGQVTESTTYIKGKEVRDFLPTNHSRDNKKPFDPPY